MVAARCAADISRSIPSRWRAVMQAVSMLFSAGTMNCQTAMRLYQRKGYIGPKIGPATRFDTELGQMLVLA